jgi:hypothetical protein
MVHVRLKIEFEKKSGKLLIPLFMNDASIPKER